jgi:hypothetical protein
MQPEPPSKEKLRFTAFPNVLLDQVMPSLKDTEWRLLCVIVRQTEGWSQNGKPKARDWMSQRQLMQKTGRNSAALSAALRQLVGRGLVEAQTASGEPLDTPQARRRHRGAIYYAVGWKTILAWDRATPNGQASSKLSVLLPEAAIPNTSQSEVRKANTTKHKGNKTLIVPEKRIRTEASQPRISTGTWSSAGDILGRYSNNVKDLGAESEP